MLNLVFKGPSPAARDMLAMALIEASATKWVPGLFLGDELVAEIRSKTGDEMTDAFTDTSKITINKAGEIVEAAFSGTKRELKEGYNMAKYGQPNVEGGTVKEWYIQSAAFSAHVVGKTADEIKGMETKEVNAHLISADEALLAAGAFDDGPVGIGAHDHCNFFHSFTSIVTQKGRTLPPQTTAVKCAQTVG